MVTAEPVRLAFVLCDRQRSILEGAVRQRSCPQAPQTVAERRVTLTER